MRVELRSLFDADLLVFVEHFDLFLWPNVVPTVVRLMSLRGMLHVRASLLCLCLVKGTLEGPLDANWISHTFYKDLIMHGFLRELGEVSMAVLDVCIEAPLIEVDVIHFSHLREVFV